MASATPPTNIGVLLFPGFQLLDICGPLDALNTLSKQVPLHLSILASTLDPVSTSHNQGGKTTQGGPAFPDSNFSQSIVPTHTFKDAPKDLEVLIIPGGFGTRDEANIAPIIEFTKSAWAEGNLKYILTVCTGSAILAKTGILDGKRATSNKKAFEWVKSQNPKVEWVAKARWVADGKLWTSSGISAGIDLIYAWIAEVWSEEVADYIADSSEYERNRDAGDDRFAARWNAV
ncbi:DJ-1/PfpI family protein-like protein [Lophiotrema nucula]|uniref:DJ-1/PfpI family protein-like protein n=1 Tax=Lophiotrema nucula TaxID=690887 RepID=A0A6A5Z6S2_9PLEO|nr:DJ-1/PfpI family protein-like protein [Lophiotrema nucula]